MVILGLIAVFVLLGAILNSGRGAAMIAGYNTLAKAEQARYDERALARFMGRIMFALSFSMVFWALGDSLQVGWLFGIGLVLFCGTTLFALVYANTGGRFKKVRN